MTTAYKAKAVYRRLTGDEVYPIYHSPKTNSVPKRSLI